MRFYRYFVSYVRVPFDETKDIRRWGNSVITLRYKPTTAELIKALEKDLAEQLELKSICLMGYQLQQTFVKDPGEPITGNELGDFDSTNPTG